MLRDKEHIVNFIMQDIKKPSIRERLNRSHVNADLQLVELLSKSISERQDIKHKFQI